LDEPTNGLDPQGIKEMREFIQELAQTGLSLFVSSHLLSEIQQMCDRVAIISHGEVIKVGEVDALIDESASRVVWRISPLEQALELLREQEDLVVLDVSRKDQEYDAGNALGNVHDIVTQLNPETVPALTRQLVESGVQLYGVETKSPTLEDLFLSLTEGKRIG